MEAEREHAERARAALDAAEDFFHGFMRELRRIFRSGSIWHPLVYSAASGTAAKIGCVMTHTTRLVFHLFAAVLLLLGAATSRALPLLQSIAVTPANPSIAKGLTQQFTATGTFSDSSTQNLTNQVTWASATTTVATINSTGLATAVNTGTSSISATLGSVSGSTTPTVTPAV